MGGVATCRCGGTTRHYRDETGWHRCECMAAVVDRVYIKSAIRLGRDTYPPELDSRPPFPLKDLVVREPLSQLNAFKDMVWRSLADYRLSNLRYDYIDAFRVVDIFFEKDPEYQSIRDLAQLPLLVVVLGLGEVPNKMFPSLVSQLYFLRADAGKPTWTFLPHDNATVARVYGQQVLELLTPRAAQTSLPPPPPPPSTPDHGREVHEGGGRGIKPRYR